MYTHTHTHSHTHRAAAATTTTKAILATTTMTAAGARATAPPTKKSAEAAATDVKKCKSGVYELQIPYGTVPYRTAYFVFFLRLHVNYLFFNSSRERKNGPM